MPMPLSNSGFDFMTGYRGCLLLLYGYLRSCVVSLITIVSTAWLMVYAGILLSLLVRGSARGNTLRVRLNVTPMENPPGFDHTVCRTLYRGDPTRSVCCPRPSAERAAVADHWAACLPSNRACRIQVHRVNAQPDSFSSQPSCTVSLYRFTRTFAVSRVNPSSSAGVTACLPTF